MDVNTVYSHLFYQNSYKTTFFSRTEMHKTYYCCLIHLTRGQSDLLPRIRIMKYVPTQLMRQNAKNNITGAFKITRCCDIILEGYGKCQ